jgi:hypothetical protein
MKVGPIRRAWIGLAMAALASALTPAVAAADDPVIERAPRLVGSAVVGARLDAVDARWRGFPTPTASWMWLRCDTDSLWSCQIIDGAAALSYTVTSADLGKRLRVLLRVTNRDGSAWTWSSATVAVAAPAPPVVTPTPTPTPVPQAAPPPPPVVVAPPAPEAIPPKLMRPEPLVRIRGWLTERGARITLLTVRAPRGAKIAVSCSGIGCPRVAPATATKLTRLRAFEGMFRAGARLVIRVTRPGFVGKHTVIRIRRGKAPLRRDRCINPGSREPIACSAG